MVVDLGKIVVGIFAQTDTSLGVCLCPSRCRENKLSKIRPRGRVECYRACYQVRLNVGGGVSRQFLCVRFRWLCVFFTSNRYFLHMQHIPLSVFYDAQIQVQWRGFAFARCKCVCVRTSFHCPLIIVKASGSLQ